MRRDHRRPDGQPDGLEARFKPDDGDPGPNPEAGEEVGWLRLARERELVLASASPRRAELLDVLGLRYVVHASGVSETGDWTDPCERARHLAGAKAAAVAPFHPKGLILGADTEVILDGLSLGKPACPRDAHRMLLRLRGRTHRVITGLCLIDAPTGLSALAVEGTLVTMRDFSNAEAAYCAYGGDSLDKAGAYGIQGLASVLVERIEGCFHNVVGLPLSRLAMMMEGLWRSIGETGR